MPRYYEQPYQYIPGTHWQICDECGRKVRNTESRLRWDGLIVCQADWEVRHPQELLYAAPTDKQAVRWARPRPEVVETVYDDPYIRDMNDEIIRDENGEALLEE